MDFKIVEVNTGFCQITYKTKSEEGHTVFYCLQDNGKNQGGVRLMRCTKDFEPQHAADFKPGVRASDLMEIPAGDSELEKLCREWILRN